MEALQVLGHIAWNGKLQDKQDIIIQDVFNSINTVGDMVLLHIKLKFLLNLFIVHKLIFYNTSLLYISIPTYYSHHCSLNILFGNTKTIIINRPSPFIYSIVHIHK